MNAALAALLGLAVGAGLGLLWSMRAERFWYKIWQEQNKTMLSLLDENHRLHKALAEKKNG